MQNKIIKIRFNTNFPEKSNFKWRVIVVDEKGWHESLTEEIVFWGLAGVTTTDTLPDGVTVKHHLTFYADICIIEEIEGGSKKIIIK